VNTALFREPLLEELRNWIDAQAQFVLILPALCRAVRVRDLRKLLERQETRIARQMRSSQQIFEAFSVTANDGNNPAVRAIVQDLLALLQHKEEGNPTCRNARILSLLRQAGHLQMATLRSVMLLCHLLEDRDTERMLETFLQEEIEGDRTLAELAPHVLWWCAAHRPEESWKSAFPPS